MGVWNKTLRKRFIDSQFSEEELERIKTLPTRQNEYGYDSFGFNREEAKICMLVVRWLYRHYFRCKVQGIEQVPSGRVMLVANHAGQLPFDAMNIAAAMLYDAPKARILRSTLDRFVPQLPYVSHLFSRWGQVVGTPENCRRLLEDEEAILVFPEGIKGISKPYTQRYQLQEFGLGFMRLALETKTPIMPVAVIGQEEQAPAINVRPLAKLMGVPSFPLMPIPPFFPAIPLPSRYTITFGEPQCFIGDADDDDEQIEQLVKHVRLSIESMVRIGLKERRSIFF